MSHTDQFDYSDLTLENYRKEHLSITETKTGKGEKQETVWYIRDRDDPKGERGSQRTVLNKAAVDWEVERAHASALQIRCNEGSLLLEAAQELTRITLRKLRHFSSS